MAESTEPHAASHWTQGSDFLGGDFYMYPRMGSELGMSAMNLSLCMHMGWAYWHGELTQITGNSVHG